MFSNPGKVREMIEGGMKGKLEQGDLDLLEFTEFNESLDPPDRADVGPQEKKKERKSEIQLRGEGGSGEPKHREVGDEGVGGEEGRGQKEEEKDWEEEEETGNKTEWTWTREEEIEGVGSNRSEDMRKMREELGDLRMYVEDQMKAINEILAPMQVQIQRLEAAIAPSVPLAQMGHRVRKSQSDGQPASPPRVMTRSGVGVPRIQSPPPTLDTTPIRVFLSKNSGYPSIRAIREAKLKQLQVSCGLVPRQIDVGVSAWTYEGLSAQIKGVHELE